MFFLYIAQAFLSHAFSIAFLGEVKYALAAEYANVRGKFYSFLFWNRRRHGQQCGQSINDSDICQLPQSQHECCNLPARRSRSSLFQNSNFDLQVFPKLKIEANILRLLRAHNLDILHANSCNPIPRIYKTLVGLSSGKLDADGTT